MVIYDMPLRRVWGNGDAGLARAAEPQDRRTLGDDLYSPTHVHNLCGIGYWSRQTNERMSAIRHSVHDRSVACAQQGAPSHIRGFAPS